MRKPLPPLPSATATPTATPAVPQPPPPLVLIGSTPPPLPYYENERQQQLPLSNGQQPAIATSPPPPNAPIPPSIASPPPPNRQQPVSAASPPPLRDASPLPTILEPSTPRFGTIRLQISNAYTAHSYPPPSYPGRAGDPPPVAPRPLSPVIPVAKQPARPVGVITPASGQAAPSIPLSPPPPLHPQVTLRGSPSPPPLTFYEYYTPEPPIQRNLMPLNILQQNLQIVINPHVGIRMGSAATANDSGPFDVPKRVRQRKCRHRPHSCILVWAFCAYLKTH